MPLPADFAWYLGLDGLDAGAPVTAGAAPPAEAPPAGAVPAAAPVPPVVAARAPTAAVPVASPAPPDLAAARDRAFADALRLVLRLEGGYANNPNDPGGATMQGVTQLVYDAYRRSRGLPPAPVRGIARAELEAIYRAGYWRLSLAERFAATHPRTACCHFDCAVNCGPAGAATQLQRALGLAAADVDGRIGPRTLAAVGAADDRALVAAYLLRRADFYRALVARRPRSLEFLPGWLARLRHVARATGTPIPAAYAGRA